MKEYAEHCTEDGFIPACLLVSLYLQSRKLHFLASMEKNIGDFSVQQLLLKCCLKRVVRSSPLLFGLFGFLYDLFGAVSSCGVSSYLVSSI